MYNSTFLAVKLRRCSATLEVSVIALVITSVPHLRGGANDNCEKFLPPPRLLRHSTSDNRAEQAMRLLLPTLCFAPPFPPVSRPPDLLRERLCSSFWPPRHRRLPMSPATLHVLTPASATRFFVCVPRTLRTCRYPPSPVTPRSGPRRTSPRVRPRRRSLYSPADRRRARAFALPIKNDDGREAASYRVSAPRPRRARAPTLTPLCAYSSRASIYSFKFSSEK